MKRQHTRGWRTCLALVLPLALVAAACADDDDEGDAQTDDQGSENQDQNQDEAPNLEGEEVTIFGPEVEVEMQSLEESFAPFEEETGVDIVVTGDRGFETQVGSQIDAGNPPDIAMFPQPGRVQEFAADIPALSDDVLAEVEENFEPGWTDPVTVDGDIKAVPAKADLKSVVWYSPSAFEDNNYEVPETLEDFEALAEQMAEDGNTPFCVGSGSDDATGWPMTDWVEDYMLRLQGPDVYDQWASHDIPFDDPQVVEAGEFVYDLWATEGYVYGGLQNAAATPFAEAGLPLLDGDCQMYRMGNFYAANWPEGTELGPEGQVDAFYLPGSEEEPNITLSGGIYAAAFSDRPEVIETMRFLASTDYADARAPVGGYLSPNQNVDTSLYPTELEQNFGEILAEASPVRFDASDLMPSAVGTGSFWTAAVDITTGAATVEEAFAEVEASWPSD
jgi:alpha-glucoside transport system substrate-binding protein